MQTVSYFERVVHKRVVDQTFPAHRGTGFLEIDTHYNQQGVANFVRQRFESVGVLVSCFEVMN